MIKIITTRTNNGFVRTKTAADSIDEIEFPGLVSLVDELTMEKLFTIDDDLVDPLVSI